MCVRPYILVILTDPCDSKSNLYAGYQHHIVYELKKQACRILILVCWLSPRVVSCEETDKREVLPIFSGPY